MPMGKPRFRLMPHWIPGSIASTSTPFMPRRTSVLLSWLGRDSPRIMASRHSRMKNRPIISLGTPIFATSGI